MAAFDKTSATHSRLSPVCHRLKRFRAKRLPAEIWKPQEKAMTRQMKTAVEHFPIAGSFTISRGSKTTASVVTCHVSDGVLPAWANVCPMRATAKPSTAYWLRDRNDQAADRGWH
jgi:hypothetical protein